MNESPRALSFCGHAINSEERIMIVEDARSDERFFDNPLVTEHQAIFYAGVPLVNPEGFKLGTLCVYDNEPRELSQKQITTLIDLSRQVVNLFEQRCQNFELVDLKNQLLERNKNLESFAGLVSHDLKSPLANIISLTDLLENEPDNVLTEDSIEYIKYLKSSSHSLSNYIDGILKFYKSDDILKNESETFQLSTFIEEVETIAIPRTENVSVTISNGNSFLTANKSALQQVFINLITNAIKYNDNSIIELYIGFKDIEDFYEFNIQDNGNGIPENHLETIFDLFTTTGETDRNGNKGTGIGLATVRKLITKLGGVISVTSTEKVGSNFVFTVAKS